MEFETTAPAVSYARLFRSGVRFLSNRSFRVIVLVSMIAVMSIADLYFTLLYVTNTGMSEANPFARAMMEYRSPVILSAWKLATVVLSQGILLYIREKRSAEIGAWLSCFVLGWLMVHWVGFIEIGETDPMQIVLENPQNDPTWIMIEADASDGNLVLP